MKPVSKERWLRMILLDFMTMLLKEVLKPCIQPKSGYACTQTHQDIKTPQLLPSLSRVKVELASRRPPANLPPDQNSKHCSGTVLLSVLTVHWPLWFAHTTQQWTQPSGFVSVWNFKVVPMADLIFILKRYSPLHVSNNKARGSCDWQFDVHLKPPLHKRSGSRYKKKPEVKDWRSV